MKLGYYVKAQGQTIKDVTYLKNNYYADPNYYDYYAEDVCDYAWDHNDGWEWIRTGTVITLVLGDKEIGDFEINVDCRPTFTAYPMEEK